MGGKSGGGQAAPYEAPNTLSSAQSLRIIDAISEGVVSGFANGDSHPLKSVFFNDTPVQALDGTYNFKGVAGYFQRGTPDQSYIPGFDVSERVVPVSAAVKLNSPIVRSVTDSLISRLRVTVAVERNAEANDKGDVHPAKTHMRVSLVNAQRAISRDVAFTEKSSGVYYQDVVFDKLPDVPFSITVTRLSPDSNSDKLSNSTFFSSYVEIIDAKLSYPHTAVAALLIDSDQFGNSIPRRNYLLKGRLVKVPSNYDPETRSYSGTMWDGSFKQAWTNNPAWVFYDVLTQPRFSTIARRLKVADIDKWSLYQIARYCDELVDDGFGGREPRFVCNAYITDLTQAGEFLQNLASVFTGMPIWNGTQISVVMDGNTDPVALYNNTNVKDGLFTYSGAAYKSIHTAVHVQYVDKHDGYRTKTEYVADDNAIARYGLNIKQITAFGCDSRGQAARFGAWTLQTELRQQNMVSFEIGREGLKHLPYDIVQVMDNRYAGAELSGRVMDIDGNTVTLDRDVSDIVGAIFFYSNSDGLQSAKVLRHPAKNKVVLEKTTGLEIMAGWALSGKVKPRLYRAIGIKENSEDGTYTVTGLLHDPQKYATVDTWAKFDRELHTLHRAEIALTNPDLAYRDGKFTLSWDNLTADGKVLSYDIKIYRNNELYRHIASAKTAEIAFENLPNGVYRAEIRGRNARGVLSEPLEKDWTIDYNITALRTAGRLMAVDVTWTLPQVVVSELSTELWYGTTNNLDDMRRLVVLPYPQNTYTLTGVAVSDRYYFRARVVDKMGNAGEWTPVVTGDADKNPTPIVQQVQGAIGKSALSQSLIASLNSDMAGAAESAAAKAQNAAAVDASNKVAAEADARQRALQAETSARTVAIQAAANKAARDLTAKAAEVGTRIGAVENVNATQAQQISTVTAAQANTAAGLETEKRARADGDKAEAAARATLAARVATAEGNITKETQARVSTDNAQIAETNALKTRVGNAESGITRLQQTVAEQGRATATQLNAITAGLNNLGGVNLLVDSEYKDLGKFYSGEPARSSSSNFRGRRLIRVGSHTDRTGNFGVAQSTSGAKTRLTAGVEYTLSFNVQGTAGVVRTGLNYVYLLRDRSEGGNHRLETIPVTSSLSNRVKVTFAAPWSSNTVRLLIGANGTFAANDWFAFHSVKLERGSVATDWSTTPDDLDAAVSAVDAALTEYKQAQATVNKAKTDEIHSARSAVAANAAEIQTLKSTKADSNQVAALARESLQSEWKGYADELNNVEYVNRQNIADLRTPGYFAAKSKGTYKMLILSDFVGIAGYGFLTIETVNAFGAPTHVTQRAISSNAGLLWTRSGRDADNWNAWKRSEDVAGAQEKANAAKTAAIAAAADDAQRKADAAKTAAERAAQAKADAAKAQAIAAASGDATSKANAAKAQAIADAAAKDAVLKQQAAADAQAKADKAKNDAIAEATRLNAATNAKIDTLKETVAEQERAISRRIDTVTAEVGKLGNAGGNLNTDSEFINGFNDQFSKEGGIFSVVKIGGVNAGKADRSQKAGDGWFTLASVPANKGIYQFSIYMLNQTAQLVKMYPRYLNRRREWVKVGTTRKLTNNTDIVPSVPSRDDPADLNGFTRVIWNVDLTASENLHFIEIALHFPAVPANQEGAAAYFAKPMICEIPHINMPPVPYAANTSSAYMAAKVEQSVSAVADVRGKLQSMYTLKTETVSGNRRVISGLALGADGQTGDSQVLVYANKFAVVDPASKSIKAPFVVKTEGGKTKMVLDGDMIASGVIQGKHIVAGSRLVSPYIVGGTLEVNSIIGGNIYEIAILPHNGQLQRTVTFLPSVAPRTIVIRWDIAQIRYVGSNSVAFGGGDWVKSVHSSEPLNARRMPGMYIQTIPANKRVAISFGADDAKISNDIFVESYLAGNARYIEVS